MFMVGCANMFHFGWVHVYVDGSVELPRAELVTQEVFRECTSAISH